MASAPAAADSATTARRIPLDPREVATTRVGALDFLAGFELIGRDPAVGGLSGLEIDPAGTTLVAVTDRGHWLAIGLQHDAEGRLSGLGFAAIRPLRDITGSPLSGSYGDAEGLSRLADGRFVVSFELHHRIDLYPEGLDARAKDLIPRGALPGLVGNAGLESLVALADGRLLALVEQPTAPGRHAGFLIGPDGAVAGLTYRTVPDFKPTDLAVLPGGDVLVLERRASLVFGFAARLVRVPAAAIAAGAALEGIEIGTLSPPLNVDNFEGLAVRQDPGGATLVYIVSDDNFSPLQRTLLLQFRLNE